MIISKWKDEACFYHSSLKMCTFSYVVAQVPNCWAWQIYMMVMYSWVRNSIARNSKKWREQIKQNPDMYAAHRKCEIVCQKVPNNYLIWYRLQHLPKRSNFGKNWILVQNPRKSSTCCMEQLLSDGKEKNQNVNASKKVYGVLSAEECKKSKKIVS